MARHYLDHASTSPPRPEVAAAWRTWLESPDQAADPSRTHTEAHAARVALEHARAAVAAFFGARPREVLFTSGATEAANAACWGAANRGDRQVVTAVEHACVRLAAARHGPVTTVGVDALGRVDPDVFADALAPDVAVAHTQLGNHEVGTLQPVAEVVDACRKRKVLVHVDAAQAAGRAAIDFGALGADLLSVSAHKMGGPPGVGALLVRRGVRLDPLVVGGDQERARRAGMENLPGALAWAAVCEALGSPSSGGAGSTVEGVSPRWQAEAAEQHRLTARLRAGLAALDGVTVLGDPDPAGRLPHLVCVTVDGVEPQAVLLGLDQAGIAAHSGSACGSESWEPSPVLAAMGAPAERSLRLSVGWSSTDADVDAVLDALPGVLARLRELR